MATILFSDARRFATVDIRADLAPLPASERQTLAHLIDAARVVDALFLEQVWAGNPALLVELASDTTPAGRERLDYFLLNKGPWSRLDGGRPFLERRTIPPSLPQANFYPANATKEEIDRWVESLNPHDREQATGFFTTIRRRTDGSLTAVPYSREYGGHLEMLGTHLALAAKATSDSALRRFLELRVRAFATNDYYDSDVAWMALDGLIEPTIGPYETYEDAWFGYKAAFEAFVTIRDADETAKLSVFSDRLQSLEDALPIDRAYRNPKLGTMAPIRVVNVVLTAGDANRGVQTAAFNLPNDDRIIREKGAKRVMLKNVQDAKFARVLQPIADVALAPEDRSKVAFEAFFTHILLHELMHGLGPHVVRHTGEPVRLALKDTYAAIEEAKADMSGLWAVAELADQGIVGRDVRDRMYETFLASAFRSIRFGLDEAHGKGIALQLNTLVDLGGVRVRDDGTFAVVADRIRETVTSLTRDVMTIQAEGNYAAARELLDRQGTIRPAVARVLGRLTDVPVDIRPRFVTAEELRA